MAGHSIQYGNSTIEYELSYAQRKTLGIAVHPDLRVSVQAPEGTALADIESKVRRRADWILKQQRQLEIYLPDVPPRQYVSGETHRYLGRQYRLKVIEDTAEAVKLTRGFIYTHVPVKSDTRHVKSLMDDWYLDQARQVFEARLAACFPRVQWLNVRYPSIAIRVMTSRWGSCSASGKMTLNIKLIQVPEEYIDYVILHELCHLKEPNHTRRFFELLDRVLPIWKERRDRLNRFEFG